MPTVREITSFSFGSELLFEKLLNNLYSSDAAKKSNSSILSDVYRKMYLSNFVSVKDILQEYFEKQQQIKEAQETKNQIKDDEAFIIERSNQQKEIIKEEYEMDSTIPQNSTVSYHV